MNRMTTFSKVRQFGQLKNYIPFILFLIFFWQQGLLIRQIGLLAPEYPHRPVGVDGSSIYFRFLELQQGLMPEYPDGNFPLFLYFLTAVRVIFRQPAEQVFLPYLGQTFMVLLAGAFTYKIGSWLFSRNVGLLSCFALLFYGRVANYTLAYANAIPILFFFTGSIFFILAYQRTHLFRYLSFGSIFLAMSVFGRGTVLAQIGVFALWFFLLRIPLKRVFLNIAMITGIVAVILSVQISYNYIIYNQLQFIIRNTGTLNFFIGNNPESQGQFYVPGNLTALIIEGQTTYTREVLNFIVEQPVVWGQLFVKKLVIFFIFPWWRVGYWSNPSPTWAVFYLVAAGVCLFYAVKLFTRYRSVLHLTIMGYALPIALFFVEERFRIPLVPMLFVFLGAVLNQIWLDVSRWLNLSKAAQLALLWGGMLSAVVLYAICPQRSVGQVIGEVNSPGIFGGMTIGQSFVSPCNNLYRIDVKIRTKQPEVSQQVIFHLQESGIDGPEIYTQPLDTYNVRRANYTSFTFPEIPDSANKAYTFYFDTAQMPSDLLGLVVLLEPDIPVDSVASGSALFNGQPMPADLTFFAYCRSVFNW